MSKQIKITILGCGTSTGVPLAGCSCFICRSENPRNKRLRTSALITTPEGYNILIDAAPDFRTQALAHSIARIDGVIFTHAHADHMLGVDDLRAFNFIQQSRIPCYGTTATLEAITSMFSYIFKPNIGYEGGALAQLDPIVIRPFEPFTIKDVTIAPFQLFHGSMEVMGFRVGHFAYATDCKLIPAESKTLLRDLDVLVLDGLRMEPHRTHFTISEAIAEAVQINAIKTFLTHMTHTVEYEQTSAILPSGVFLAYDGLSFEARYPNQ